MDTNNLTPPVTAAPMLRGAELCRPSEKWTCTIQCDGGTRAPIERLFNAPGVEACVVTGCHCQIVPPSPPPIVVQPQEVLDAQLPLALVIFGARQLLTR